MTKQPQHRFESVGWLFWFIVFAAALFPCIYGSYQIVAKDVETVVTVGMGTLLAAFVAACVAWGVNSVLSARTRRQQARARKQSKRK